MLSLRLRYVRSLSLGLLLGLPALPLAAQAEPDRQHYQIAAQPLATALIAFS